MRNQLARQPSPVAFRFQNIGPIREATLGLGRLTVIAGRNNTGKTYVVYSLYGFLKAWDRWSWEPGFMMRRSDTFPEVKAISDGLRADGQVSVPVSPSTLDQQRRILADWLGKSFSRQFQSFFNAPRGSFTNAQLRVELPDLPNAQAPLRGEVQIGQDAIAVQYDDGTVSAFLKGNNRLAATKRLGAPIIAYSRMLMHDLFPTPFILSSERFGISLFYKELDFTKNQIVDLLQKHAAGNATKGPSPYLIVDRSTSRYATPIKDNIDFTRSIPDLPRDFSPLADYKLSNCIKDMMQGYYSNANDDLRFIAKARKRGHFNIPLHLASSSARGLSDLYFFLRHSASRNQLLIIDEPESHLDTANQVQFARLLARFVGAGLRVVITTHSDYIVKELNNLIMLSRDFPEKENVTRRFGYRSEDELQPESVRAYVAENSSLTECTIDCYGIAMPVFDRTIDHINAASIELSSRVPSESCQ